MSETDTDGFYWEPDSGFPLRQGDLLLNVPSTLLPSEPEFVLRIRDSDDAHLLKYAGFPENAPSTDIVTVARWGALAMVITPTCHLSEGEKDEDVVAIVPVEPLPIAAPRDAWPDIRQWKGALHLFYLPPTELAAGLIPFEAVALLDRPTSLFKQDLREYRKLGLYRDFRFELRKKMASFWARASATEYLEDKLAQLTQNNVPLERIE